jgi:hypothetical protein
VKYFNEAGVVVYIDHFTIVKKAGVVTPADKLSEQISDETDAR